MPSPWALSSVRATCLNHSTTVAGAGGEAAASRSRSAPSRSSITRKGAPSELGRDVGVRHADHVLALDPGRRARFALEPLERFGRRAHAATAAP